ncbi:MAG TPA: MBL fold metallo-hydrolase [Bacteroidota bacterium]|nr:MBL fold metallo-hydrolase [Bacteroidota bacterium]
MISFLIVVVFIGAGGAFLHQAKFGHSPSGERLKRIERSPNFRNGNFQNQLPTPMMKEGISIFGVAKDFLFDRSSRSTPPSVLPTVKTNLFELNRHDDVVVWFGHSSYFMQIDGKRFLVDPVLCGSASPVPITTRSFAGTDAYTPADIPEIDYLLITHDHWDHLDHETLMQLKPKINTIVTGLGVGEHLEAWGFDPVCIIEKDWNESADLGNGVTITATPARHFSGRGLTRNNTLWVSMVLKTPHQSIFLSGDGGYGPHFETIGRMYGPFDLALIECGQYNESWKYIHMKPEETVQAARDLQARKFIPIHWSKFILSLHAWDESIVRVTKEAERLNIPILHPMIGQSVRMNHTEATPMWWEAVR